MPLTADEDLRRLLERDPIAVIGCSGSSGKAAHDVPAYLQRHGYRIIPINPSHDEILGETAYESLAAVPDGVALVEVFRPSREVDGIVDQILDRHASNGDADAMWLQLGIRDDEAAARAEDAGIEVVQDRCMKVEHGRLL